MILLFNKTRPADELNETDNIYTPAIKQLEFWAISSENNQNEELLQILVNEFNTQHNTIHINLGMKSDKYFYRIFSTAIASQTNPDLSILFNAQAVQFFDRGFLFSLDSVVNDVVDDGQEFYPKILEQAKLYKQYFGIPMSIENYILLVRKDVFKKRHLEIPENLADLLIALPKISSEHIVPIALPTKGYLSSRSLLYFIMVNGGSIFDYNNCVELETNKNTEVFEFLNKLSLENLIYKEKALGIKDVSNLFIRGEVAAILTTPTALRDIYDNTDKDFIKNIEIVSLRGFDDRFHSSGPVFTQVLCVYKNSQRKEEAQIFVEWLLNRYSESWSQNPGCEISSIITNNGGAILNEEFTRKVFEEIIPNASYPSDPMPNSVNYIVVEATDVLNRLMQDLTHEVDVDELLIKYQNEIDKFSEVFNR